MNRKNDMSNKIFYQLLTSKIADHMIRSRSRISNTRMDVLPDFQIPFTRLTFNLWLSPSLDARTPDENLPWLALRLPYHIPLFFRNIVEIERFAQTPTSTLLVHKKNRSWRSYEKIGDCEQPSSHFEPWPNFAQSCSFKKYPGDS